ncbi:hypothetical protein [Vulgatibacter sp.]|uniref:DUF7151 family protein n=1 Tax=Vulgatibacter sp. TaxID=1971226 RepID=UPI0035634826
MKSIATLAALAAFLLSACGAEQEACTVAEENGVRTMRCPDGTSAEIPGPVAGGGCTVEENGDGTRTVRCADGTETVIEDGAPGNDGKDGTDGTDGRPGRDGTDGTNGRPGTDGTDGIDGEDGAEALVRTEPEPAGSTCPTGGTRIIAGVDRDRDGVLDPEEETDRTVICNGRNGTDGTNGSDGQDGEDGQDGQDGSDGSDGATALVDMVDEPAGANCGFGGIKIVAGLDLDADGVLSANEVTSTRFVCNAPTWTFGLRYDAEWDAMGAGVANLVGFRAQIVGAYDPFARLRWRVRFTDATGAPVAGIALATGADPIEWRSWTEESFSDAQGEVILGGSGFEAGAAGLLAAGGAHVQWRITPPAAGTINATVELLSLGNTVVGSGTAEVQVAPVLTGITLWGFGEHPATVRNLAVINSRVAPTVDPDELVSWRYTVLDGAGAPVQGVAFHYDLDAVDGFDHAHWTDALVTDASGVAVRSPAGIAARELQLFRGANFPVSFALTPGTYTLQVELLEVAGGTVLATDTETLTVAHLPALANFLHFDAVQADARSFVAIQARHATTATPTETVQWRVTLSSVGATANTPIDGEELFVGDAADHLYHAWWTDSVTTDASGMALVGDPFPAVEAMGLEGVILPFSLRLPTGSYELRLQLVETAGGTAVWDHVTTFTVPVP